MKQPSTTGICPNCNSCQWSQSDDKRSYHCQDCGASYKLVTDADMETIIQMLQECNRGFFTFLSTQQFNALKERYG